MITDSAAPTNMFKNLSAVSQLARVLSSSRLLLMMLAKTLQQQQKSTECLNTFPGMSDIA